MPEPRSLGLHLLHLLFDELGLLLLRVDDLAVIADDTGRALLADLPHRRNPNRPDSKGLLAALIRDFAVWLAKRPRT